MAFLDDLSKKAAKLTEKTIDVSSKLADNAKIKISIKSKEADLDQEYIKLGKLYYQTLAKTNLDNQIAAIVHEIETLENKIKQLQANLNE